MKESSPSGTARLISLCILYLHFEKSNLVSNKYILFQKNCIDSFGKRKNLILRLLKFSFFRKIISVIESTFFPNLIAHYAIRKNILSEIALDLFEKEKISTLLVLGSGFDTFSLRVTDQFPKIKIWELDHPATQLVKKISFEKTGIKKENFVLHPVDFFHEALFPKDIQFEESTLVYAEGLFMYLSEQKIKEHLFSLSFNFKNVYLLFTFIEVNLQGKPIFYDNNLLVNSYLRVKREPFLWGIQATDLKDFLKPLGFDLMQIISPNFVLKSMPGSKLKKTIRENIALAKLKT